MPLDRPLWFLSEVSVSLERRDAATKPKAGTSLISWAGHTNKGNSICPSVCQSAVAVPPASVCKHRARCCRAATTHTAFKTNSPFILYPAVLFTALIALPNFVWLVLYLGFLILGGYHDLEAKPSRAIQTSLLAIRSKSTHSEIIVHQLKPLVTS